MKTLLISLIALSSLFKVQAQIDWTRAECEARYGAKVRVYDGYYQFVTKVNGLRLFIIEEYDDKSRVISVSYATRSNRPFPTAVVSLLLDASSPGSRWTATLPTDTPVGTDAEDGETWSALNGLLKAKEYTSDLGWYYLNIYVDEP